jgi:hypothetical protein
MSVDLPSVPTALNATTCAIPVIKLPPSGINCSAKLSENVGS